MTRSREWLYGWLLLLPAAVLLGAFTHFPAVATFIESFYSTPKGARPSHFVGLDNYRAMIEDPIFWKSLENNAIYAAGTIPASIALALLMALWVNGKIRGRVKVAADADEATVVAAALAEENVKKNVEGKELVKRQYVAGRILTLVVKG